MGFGGSAARSGWRVSRVECMDGTIFDIKEFAINDGPGVRITVFLKGCPLRCKWCHNPEGLSCEPQKNLRTGRIVGERWTDHDLCAYLLKYKPAYDISGGGVTFSGGEATMQDKFLISCSERLRAHGVNVNLDTCGYCDKTVFRGILRHVDLCYYDVKCMDSKLHQDMTGVGNELILENLKVLAESDVRYHVRIPLIPHVSDTAENRLAAERFIKGLSRQPESIDWLPFNSLASAKYAVYGMKYRFAE